MRIAASLKTWPPKPSFDGGAPRAAIRAPDD